MGGSGVAAGWAIWGGAKGAGGCWAAATARLGGTARAAVGVATGGCAAIFSWALARSLVRIWIWQFMDSSRFSTPVVGRSCRILSILLAADTTSSMVLYPNFCTSAANGRSRAPRNASTACLSAASSSRGCKRLASFSASLANSIISLDPLFSCLREAQASSLTEPAPKRDSKVSLAASQVAPSSKLARILYLWCQLAAGTK